MCMVVFAAWFWWPTVDKKVVTERRFWFQEHILLAQPQAKLAPAAFYGRIYSEVSHVLLCARLDIR
jgi:hypothetical protein